MLREHLLCSGLITTAPHILIPEPPVSFRGQGCCFQTHATGKAAEVPHTQRHQVVVLEFNSVNAAHLGCTPAGCQAAPASPCGSEHARRRVCPQNSLFRQRNGTVLED